MDIRERKRMRREKKKWISNNRKFHHTWLIRIISCLIILIFFVNMLTKDKDFSDNENRPLAKKPKFTVTALSSGSYAKDYETYYSDQFVGRDAWMSAKYNLDYMMGKREFSGIYIGKKGYLLSKPEEPDEEALKNTVSAMNGFAEKYPDVKMYALIVPDAASIMPEMLPNKAPVRDQVKDIADLEGKLIKNFRIIDAADALNNAYQNANKATKEKGLYYKTDHHWTSLGALTVFQEAASVLGVNMGEITYTPHTVSETFKGTLASRSGNHKSEDSIVVYEPTGTDVIYNCYYPDSQKKTRSIFDNSKLDEKDQYTVFFGGNHPVVEIETTSESGKNLLIFKDSYANSFVQFLTPYYEHIILIDPRYYYDDVSNAMKNYGVTDVLYLYSADTLLVDTSLSDTLNAAINSNVTGSGNGAGNATPSDASPSDAETE